MFMDFDFDLDMDMDMDLYDSPFDTSPFSTVNYSRKKMSWMDKLLRKWKKNTPVCHVNGKICWRQARQSRHGI